jgi:Domain of unknown function (DUF1848)
MPHVISASRRTDIPAFYADWFANRLREGTVFVKNPYSRKVTRISLAQAEVSAIVFWSKNYAPLISRLEEIEHSAKDLFFHFTITANAELERRVPSYRDAARDYRYLVRRYSPQKVVWRFDPICITDKLPFEIHEERFIRCAELLKGHARDCIISFAHPYKKVISNMRKYSEHALSELPPEKKRGYASRLAKTAGAYGITLHACCNDYLLSDAVKKASCIDGRRLTEVFGRQVSTLPAATRGECACTRSVDIGSYDTCAHGCVYCYANSDSEKAREAPMRQDPAWNALGTHAVEEEEAEEQRALPL